MEFILDTANIEEIRTYAAVYPILGVTSNPSIVKKEGKISFFDHFKEIRKIIGEDKSLHIQVTAADWETMVREGKTLLEKVDEKVFVKVPVTEQGLKAIKMLKEMDISVTATAIYTKIQGYMAMECGADYLAPYYNRMENMDIDAFHTIHSLACQIDRWHYNTKIVAASFKNMGQVNMALEAGAHAVTVQPELFHAAFSMPAIGKAVDDFQKDWKRIYGEKNITQL